MQKIPSKLAPLAWFCLGWLILLALVPFLMVLALSFLERGYSEFYVLKPSLSAYLKLFDSVYLKVFLESLKLAFFTTIICLLMAYPFAYFLAVSPKKWRQILFFLVIVPFWTSSLIRTYSLIAIVKTNGLLNKALLALGFISTPVEILYTDWAVLIGLVYTMLPYMILPLYSNLEKMDHSLHEAAMDLGADSWKVFTKITLPLSFPGILAGCILVFIPALGLFFIPDILGGSKSLVLGSLIRDQFLITRNWPFGASLSVLLIGGMLLLMFTYQWTKKRQGSEGEFL